MGTPGTGLDRCKAKRITIVGLNDFHGQLDPTKQYDGWVTANSPVDPQIEGRVTRSP